VSLAPNLAWRQRGTSDAYVGDEIAQAVLLLVDNGFITGQTIMVNGGALFS
jgi:hypothetical protein